MSLVAFFVLVLPFAYVAQVLFGRPEVAAFAYLPLLGAAAMWAIKEKCVSDFFKDAFRRPCDLLGLGIIFLLVHSGVAAVYAIVIGDFKYGVRGLLIYFVPLIIIPLIRFAEENAVNRVFKVVAIVGTVVAAELTYENFHVYVLKETTVFQSMNYQYVRSVSGLELSRLYATNYRPTGLLEHIHATVFFVGIAAISWSMRYLNEGRRYQLAMFSFCCAVFALHGARLAFAALTVGVFVFLVSQRSGDQVNRDRIRTAGWVFFLTIVVALLSDPFGTVRMYYLPAVLRNDFLIAEGGTPLSVYQGETGRFLQESPLGKLLQGQVSDTWQVIHALIGFGVVNALRATGGTSDDAYFLQLIGQYGLLGALVFFGMWLYAIRICFLALMRNSPAQRRLAGFAMAILVVLLLSIVHSPAMQRKAIYPMFVLAIAIAYRFRSVPERVILDRGSDRGIDNENSHEARFGTNQNSRE